MEPIGLIGLIGPMGLIGFLGGWWSLFEGGEESAGLGGADEGLELLWGRLADALERLEVLEQHGARLGADAGDVVEGALHLALAALLAVEGDGEAVGLVAQALDDVQRLAVLVDVEGHAVAREIDLVEPLGYAHDGNLAVQTDTVESFSGRGDLSLTTIDDE